MTRIIIFIVVAVLVIGAGVYYKNNQPIESEVNPMDQTKTVAQTGDTVTVNYTGKFASGTIFDSSAGREPFTFTLGAGEVIKGWDEGLVGMKVGEKKVLTISPDKAYGAEGVKDPRTGAVIIPPNATLIFDVELLAVK